MIKTGKTVLFLFRLNTLNNTLSLFISCIFCKSLYPQGGAISGDFISLIYSGLI